MNQMQDSAQDAALGEHEGRLDELEDRLGTTFPTPDTTVGAEQRFRFEVPTPATVLTVGGRGTNASDGRPVGPGGVAFRTVENFAAEIVRDAILDVTGTFTLHSEGAFRLLTPSDLALSGRAGVHVATASGNVEVTAGGVSPADPSFTVVPSMDVPDPSVVDTAGPRSATETSKWAWSETFKLVEIAETALKFRDLVQAPSLVGERTVVGIIQASLSMLGFLRAAVGLAVEGAEALQSVLTEVEESAEPKVKIHGAGGVDVTSPQKVGLFGIKGAKVESPLGAGLSGGVSASVKSPVAAKVFGGLMATLKSEGVVKVAAHLVAMSGDYVELNGKEGISMSSKGDTSIASDGRVVVSASTIAASGGQTHISSSSLTKITSVLDVDIESDRHVRTKVGPSELMIESGGVSIAHESTKIDVSQTHGVTVDVGGGTILSLTRSRLQCRQLSLMERESVLRGQVRLG